MLCFISVISFVWCWQKSCSTHVKLKLGFWHAKMCEAECTNVKEEPVSCFFVTLWWVHVKCIARLISEHWIFSPSFQLLKSTEKSMWSRERPSSMLCAQFCLPRSWKAQKIISGWHWLSLQVLAAVYCLLISVIAFITRFCELAGKNNTITCCF